MINPQTWSSKKGKAIEKDITEKNLNTDLSKMEMFITENLNISQKENEIIDSLWLEKQINNFFNKPKLEKNETNYSILNNYLDYYISEKEKDLKKGLLSPGTFKRYNTVKNNLLKFQKHIKKKLKISDVNRKLIQDLEAFCFEELKYNTNTMGRFIKHIKTITSHARDHKGIPTHIELNSIKGYTAQAMKTYLSFEELELVENTTLKQEYLDNARDWLIIGCYTGQRVSDLLNFTSSDLIQIEGKDLIQIKQQKTQKLVSIPVHSKVRKILEKRQGEFPRKISDQKFNLYIKEVAKLAGINTKTRGMRINPETKRKEDGIYEKWELVTSHICRRSFATNFYGKIPTSLIIGITAHSTEKQYLEYVGKPEQDKSLQVAEIWENEEKKAQKTIKLKIVNTNE